MDSSCGLIGSPEEGTRQEEGYRSLGVIADISRSFLQSCGVWIADRRLQVSGTMVRSKETGDGQRVVLCELIVHRLAAQLTAPAPDEEEIPRISPEELVQADGSPLCHEESRPLDLQAAEEGAFGYLEGGELLHPG